MYKGNRIKSTALLTAIAAVITILVVWWRFPIHFGDWNKQTLYVGMLDTWYGCSKDSQAHAMWIDDDSGEGILIVKKIADKVGIQPVFAVIAERMAPIVADSLVSWQYQGAGIILHGLRHEQWVGWDEQRIANDIHQSYILLKELGFDTTKILKIIVPPHACNTNNIRNVIKDKGYQLITGASLVNPDRSVFQLGRIAITPQTDTTAMRELLQKAYDKKAFVIFGTHSSLPASFSEGKTLKVLRMAKEIGFDFEFNRQKFCNLKDY